MKKVLISGGSGLIGTRLTAMLLEEGYEVSHLSRSAKKKKGIEVFKWDVEASKIPSEAVKGVNHLIHLAGAGIADKRWTKSRKKDIIDSRIKSTALLRRVLEESGQKLDTYIGASAIGYYGNRGEALLTEDAESGNNFTSETTVLWEKAHSTIKPFAKRMVMPRIGIVLSDKGGALPKSVQPAKFGLSTFFGRGKQFYSWIHQEDMCRILLYAIENEQLEGVYNAVAPLPVRNLAYAKAIARAVNRPELIFPAPEFALRIALGEMADIVLDSVNCSSKKIEEAGFKFLYKDIDSALSAIYS